MTMYDQEGTEVRPKAPYSRRSVLTLGSAAALLTTLEWSAPAQAAEPTPLGRALGQLRSVVPTRRVRAFDDQWLFFKGVASGAEEKAFGDGTWRVVQTPHDWSIEDLPNPTAADGGATAGPAVFVNPTATAPTRIGPFDATVTTSGSSQAWTVGGEGWYRKHFDASDIPSGARVEVRFNGIYQNSDVWINGNHLGFQGYGYTPIAYDLTPYLRRSGDNVLSVRVRNIGATSRWYSGSGIFRNVELVTTNSLRVAQYGVRVTTHDVSSTSAVVSVAAKVVNGNVSESLTRVRVTLLNPKGRRIDESTTVDLPIGPGADREFLVDFTVNRPQLWDGDNPDLYTAEVEVIEDKSIVDTDSSTFGIRSIEMSGSKGLLVNGKSVKLRGANLHSDLGGLGGASIAQAELRRLKLVKAAGFNSVRTSHNPASTYFYDACDQLGLLVISELYDGWSAHKRADDYATYFDQAWRHDVRRTLERDANHPSIIMWSTANEINIRSRPPLQDVYGEPIADFCREVDPSRPVTQGSAMGHLVGLRIPDNSPEWDYIDVASVQYLDQFSEMHAAHPDMPFYIGETHGARTFDFTKSVNENEWIIGEFAWTGMDYLGEAGLGAIKIAADGAPTPGGFGSPYPTVVSYCGDLDLIGQPKPQLAWRHVIWGVSNVELAVERPVPAGFHQVPANWSFYDELKSWTWDVPAGQLMTVRVYTSGDRVALKLNGALVEEKAVVAGDKMIATFKVPYSPGTLSATAYQGSVALGTQTLTTVGAPTTFRLTCEEGKLPNDAGALGHVLVEVVDDQGRLVPDATVKVNFSVSGNISFVSASSANPHYVDSYRQPRRYTYHGQALAIVTNTRANGRGKLTVSADGMAPATINV